MNIKLLLKSALLKDSIIYGITNALFTGLPLLLMPFLVAVLNPEDYGKIDLFRSLTMILTPIIGLSTVQAVTRFYFDLDEKEFKELTSSIILLQIINTFVALFLIFLFNLFYKTEYNLLITLSILYFLFNQITETLLSIYRLKKLSLKYLLIRIGSVILDLLLLGILYYYLVNYDWTYRVIPNIISTVCIGIVSLFLLYKNFEIKFKINNNLLKSAILYSSPLIIHMISGYILNIGDRFFITYFLGTKELGNYSVAYQIGLAVSFFYTSFSLAWTPTFFELLKKQEYKKIKKIKTIIFIIIPIIGLFSILGWIIITKFIPNLDKYNVDLNLVIVITSAYVIYSLYRFNSLYYFYYKKTRLLSTITLITGIICIILYIIFIPILGIIGAAISSFVTFLIMFISTYVFKPSK